MRWPRSGADVDPARVHEPRRSQDPDDRDRDEDLPAEPHDLVVAVTGERRAEPEETEQEETRLEHQPVQARCRQPRDVADDDGDAIDETRIQATDRPISHDVRIGCDVGLTRDRPLTA